MNKLVREGEVNTFYRDLDPLLIKTWTAVGAIPEVAEGHKVSEEDIVRECSKCSALAAIEHLYKNPELLRTPPKQPEPPRNRTFQKIKQTIDNTFEDIGAHESTYLDILFDQTPILFEREAGRSGEKLSVIEQIFLRAGTNLTRLNLYNDTGVYIMHKALQKIASTNTSNGAITVTGIRRILRLAREYELLDLAYEDSGKTHFLKDTVKELVGEKHYDALVKQIEEYEKYQERREQERYKHSEEYVRGSIAEARANFIKAFWGERK